MVVNPPGMVHAVGAGILLYEVQQSSDLTYRLYDYGRVDAVGRPRELHLDKALEVADLTAAEAELPGVAAAPSGKWRRLVSRPEFVLDAVRLDGPAFAEGATDGSACHVLTALSGEARLAWNGSSLTLPRGSTVLLPAVFGSYRLEGDGEVVRAAAA